MNLYLRYFDKETLVTNVDDAIAFLRSIQEIGMNPGLEADIRDYVASDVYYPKRYKVRQRVYFIIIKTTAATMLDFKQKKALHPMPAGGQTGCPSFAGLARTAGLYASNEPDEAPAPFVNTKYPKSSLFSYFKLYL